MVQHAVNFGRKRFVVWSGLLLILVTVLGMSQAAPVSAQVPGFVQGVVTTPSGQPVFGVDIKDPNTGAFTRSVPPGGDFALWLISGVHTLTATKTGYQYAEQKNVFVPAGSAVTVNFVLVPDPRTSIGVYRSSNGTFYLKNDLLTGYADRTYRVDLGVGIPFSGDWFGEGYHTVGVFAGGSWMADINGNGVWEGCSSEGAKDVCVAFGTSGDIPVVGDWDGDGRDNLGVYRQNRFLLDTNGDFALESGCTDDRCVTLGNPGDIPVAGDWNGNGVDTVGVFRNGQWYLDVDGNGISDWSFAYGTAGDIPIVGDWNGDGVDTVGVYSSNGLLHLRNSNSSGSDNYTFVFGTAGDIPVAGLWK